MEELQQMIDSDDSHLKFVNQKDLNYETTYAVTAIKQIEGLYGKKFYFVLNDMLLWCMPGRYQTKMTLDNLGNFEPFKIKLEKITTSKYTTTKIIYLSEEEQNDNQKLCEETQTDSQNDNRKSIEENQTTLKTDNRKRKSNEILNSSTDKIPKNVTFSQNC